jgi:hypothetical protein
MLRVFSNRSLITDFPTPDRLLPTTAMYSVSLYQPGRKGSHGLLHH